ncbi:hypothetical protein G7026_01850 [Pseudomonas azotifigens]|uniref:Uncharacterized protein n=1 Tax=Stutzerimonas azotifigens TaxID=291995 RepID=A0ABR5YW00_9GAMM|nr:hypothetical protein [Stutzerimonas azotifigens]MBA1272091.1 hypothetical protein [Stutzerimonas azotifigens]
MSTPLDKATSQAPSTIGEGCVRRYDPEELSENHGTEFPEAAQLWQRLQEQAPDGRDTAEKSSGKDG